MSENTRIIRWLIILAAFVVMIVTVGVAGCDIRNRKQAAEMADKGYCWEAIPFSSGARGWRPCSKPESVSVNPR